MSCEIQNPITLGCRDSNGGIREIYIGNFIGDDLTFTLANNSTTTTYQFGLITPYQHNGITYSLYQTYPIILDTTSAIGDVITITTDNPYYEGTASVLLDYTTTGTGIVTDQLFEAVTVGGSYVVNTVVSPYPTGTIIDFDAPTDYSLFTFPQPNEVAYWNTDGQFSNENQTSFYINQIGMTFYQMSADTNELLTILGRGRFLLFFLDNNGRYFMLGYNNSCTVNISTGGSGKSMGDLNGVQIVFESKEARLPYEVAPEAALQLLQHDLNFEVTLKPAMTIEFGDNNPSLDGYWECSYVPTVDFISTKGVQYMRAGIPPIAYSAAHPLSAQRLPNYISGLPPVGCVPTFTDNTQIDFQPPYIIAGGDMLVYWQEVMQPKFLDNDDNVAYDVPVILIKGTLPELRFYAQSDIETELYTTNTSTITLRLTKSTPTGHGVPAFNIFNSSWIDLGGTFTADPIEPVNSILWTVGRGVHTVGVQTDWGTYSTPALPSSYRTQVVTVF